MASLNRLVLLVALAVALPGCRAEPRADCGDFGSSTIPTFEVDGVVFVADGSPIPPSALGHRVKVRFDTCSRNSYQYVRAVNGFSTQELLAIDASIAGEGSWIAAIPEAIAQAARGQELRDAADALCGDHIPTFDVDGLIFAADGPPIPPSALGDEVDVLFDSCTTPRIGPEHVRTVNGFSAEELLAFGNHGDWRAAIAKAIAQSSRGQELREAADALPADPLQDHLSA